MNNGRNKRLSKYREGEQNTGFAYNEGFDVSGDLANTERVNKIRVLPTRKVLPFPVGTKEPLACRCLDASPASWSSRVAEPLNRAG